MTRKASDRFTAFFVTDDDQPVMTLHWAGEDYTPPKDPTLEAGNG